MNFSLKLTCATLAVLIAASAHAQVSDNVVKIGVLVDMSGPYSGIGGKGGVAAVQMAVADFGGKVLGKPIEVVSADYQGKIDVTATTARSWYDQDHVDMIIESTDSSSALALQKIGEEKKRITIFAGSATSALTNAECSPYGIHYVYDTYALAHGTGSAITKEGGKKWYFITADFAFGESLESETAKVVKDLGGTVVGSVRHPVGASDFASYLVSAQSSGAQVIGLADAGRNMQNAVKQAAEFGLTKQGKTLAPLLIFDTDLKGMGLKVAQGLQFTTGFYWNYDDQTRAWSKRFYEKTKTMPTMVQAGMYSAVIHYLNAIKAVGTDATLPVMKAMKAAPINDFFAKNGKIRADGLMVHDMYLAEAKKPSESKGEWDLLKIRRVIPGAEAFQPLSESTCPLLRK